MHHLLLAEVFPASGQVGVLPALQLQRPHLVTTVPLGQPVLRVLEHGMLHSLPGAALSEPVLVLPPLRLCVGTSLPPGLGPEGHNINIDEQASLHMRVQTSLNKNPSYNRCCCVMPDLYRTFQSAPRAQSFCGHISSPWFAPSCSPAAHAARERVILFHQLRFVYVAG